MILKKLHELGSFHRDFHSGNILQVYSSTKNTNSKWTKIK